MTASIPIDPNVPGPLDAVAAGALLASADDLLAAGEPDRAAALYGRVLGHADAAITARALVGLGDAIDRMGHDDAALDAWRRAVSLPPTAWTYPALWRIAGALVRRDDLAGAREAYRRAEPLAPPEDRAEVASRLGWLAKELGDERGARRAFARSRGTEPAAYVAIGTIALTSVVSIAALSGDGSLLELLALDKHALAAGEWWRLLTVTLVHGSLIHLALNMYALWLAGTFVERLYGSWKTLLFYVLAAAAGSASSFAFGGGIASVGASGAVFGLFGVLFAAQRVHAPVLDRRTRMVLGQIGMLIVLNLLLGFGLAGGGVLIDNAAHVGGLAAGLWLGFLVVPGNVPTLASGWLRPGGSTDGHRGSDLLRALGVAVLVVTIAVLVVIGAGTHGA